MAEPTGQVGGGLVAAAAAFGPWFAAITAAVSSIRAMWAALKKANPKAVMDKTNGNVYESMEAAVAAGADPANLVLTVDDAVLVQTLLTNAGLLKAEAAEAEAWAKALPR